MYTPALLLPLIVACAQSGAPLGRTDAVTAAASATSDPPSVLVIVLDDVGVGDLGVAEHVQGFAAEGLSFTRAYSFPVCSSSRLAAMFGLLPRRAGLGDIVNTYQTFATPSPYPPRTLLSIAETIKPAGYRTGLFGKYHLGRPGGLLGEVFDVSSSPFVQGWDTWRAGSPDSIAFGPGDGYWLWDRVNDGNRGISTIYATDLQVAEFLTWWNAPGAAPRLGWLALSAAHAPYDAPPGYSLAATPREQFEDVIDYADTKLAEVLSAVDFATTYVILVGDNGTPDEARPPGSPSGVWKGSTREGGVRVPFIVVGPGISPGETSQLVSLVDLPATICDLLGLSWSSSDSVSVFGSPRSWVFTERYHATLDDVAVIEASWKLRVFDPDGPGPLPSEEEPYWLGDGGEEPLVPSQTILDRLHAELASVPPRL